MAYTNSSLVNYKKISPNRTKNRNHKIDTITIHCVVGQLSVQSLGSIFAKSSKEASSNYGIGYDGKIGLYVEEKDRSWCSSNSANDHRAVTIEVASDTKSPYAVNSKAYNALINLVADICLRNSIKKLVWSTSKTNRVNHKNGCNMTVHRDYASKACPGKYLYDRMGKIAEAVNKKLDGVKKVADSGTEAAKSATTSTTFKVGEIVQFNGGKQYTSSTAKTGSTAKATKAKITKIVTSGAHKVHLRACNDKGKFISGVYGWVDSSTIKKVTTTSAEPAKTKPAKPVDTTAKATLTNIKVGDIVQFSGGKQYTSSTAKTGSTVAASKAKITKIVTTGTHKVHLRACNGSGSYIKGVYGWVDIGSIKKIVETPPAKATPSANGKKIADMAIKCAYSGEPAEAKYPDGKIKAEYKTALNKAYTDRSKWGAAPRAGASCDVFVGTCVRASGVDSKFPRGLDPQYPYLASSTKFKLVTTAPKPADLLDGDIIIYGSSSKTEPSHIMIYAGGKLRHAYLKKWYGRTTTDVAARLKNKKMIKLYRAK